MNIAFIDRKLSYVFMFAVFKKGAKVIVNTGLARLLSR